MVFCYSQRPTIGSGEHGDADESGSYLSFETAEEGDAVNATRFDEETSRFPQLCESI